MRRTSVLTGSFSLLLLLVMLGALFVTPVAASQEISRVPAEYSTIQAAINAANPGDIIQVASKIYYEHVVVNKSLTLIGEESSTTIIDGSGTGIVVRINASDVEFRGFTVQNSGDSPLADSGILIGGCIRNVVRDNMIRNSAIGIVLHWSNGCIIVGNTIMNNSDVGIVIRDGSNNEIHYNRIANNSMGVWIATNSSLFNMFYHNNFIDNPNQAQSSGAWTTKWDNGAEGNYWSDYVSVDANGDGIGDTPYPRSPWDEYPLIEPWSPHRVFNVTINEITYYVTTFSNSTIASFNLSRPLKNISFNATSGASGFCKVTIPKVLLRENFTHAWVVLIDGLETTYVKSENETHASLYFNYTHSTHRVQIIGAEVIPEFSPAIIMPLFIALTLIITIIRKKKFKDARK